MEIKQSTSSRYSQLVDTTDTIPTTLRTDSNRYIRSAYGPRLRLEMHFPPEGKTKQSFKDECDVNRIMARYLATGELPNLNALPPQYLDVTEMDFQEHQNFIAEANSMFNQLPSAIRARFENNPGAFLDFCSQEKNRPELAEMGLLRPIEEPLIPAPHLTPSTAQNVSNPVTGAAASGESKNA